MKSISVFRIPDNKPEEISTQKGSLCCLFRIRQSLFRFFRTIDRTAIIFNHNYRRKSCYHIVRGRLVWITNRIPCYRRLVCIRPFPAKMTFSIYFLALSHAPPPAHHRNRYKKPCDNRPHQYTTRCSRPKKQTDQNRNDHRQQGRRNHFPDRRRSQHIDRSVIPGFRRPCSSIPAISRNCRPNFENDSSAATTDRLHDHGTEQAGNQDHRQSGR